MDFEEFRPDLEDPEFAWFVTTDGRPLYISEDTSFWLDRPYYLSGGTFDVNINRPNDVLMNWLEHANKDYICTYNFGIDAVVVKLYDCKFLYKNNKAFNPKKVNRNSNFSLRIAAKRVTLVWMYEVLL